MPTNNDIVSLQQRLTEMEARQAVAREEISRLEEEIRFHGYDPDDLDEAIEELEGKIERAQVRRSQNVKKAKKILSRYDRA
jgi:chromosome segregation ATPase